MGLSVEGIGPISGYSSVSPLSYVSARQNAYAIDNQSEISDEFVSSLKDSSRTGDIQAAPPVQYANARAVRVGGAQQAEAAQRVGRAYNDIAESFGGISTSYDAASNASSYAILGSNFDAYA